MSRAARFGTVVEYEDEFAENIKACEEQLKRATLKKDQKKQQWKEKIALIENEERRRSRAARKEEERRLLRDKIRRWKLAGQKQQEVIEQHEKQYHEMKQLAAFNMKHMKEEMEQIETQLKEETSKRDHARKAKEIKRKEVLAKREQDKKMHSLSDVKVETLKNQKIGFYTTSDELQQSQTSTSIPHADDVEVHGINRHESHSDVTRAASTLSLIHDVPVFVLSDELMLPGNVTDEVDCHDCQSKLLMTLPVIMDEQAASQHQSTDHRCSDCKDSERYSMEVFVARSSSDVTALYQADIPHKITDVVEQAVHPAIPNLPHSHDSTACVVHSLMKIVAAKQEVHHPVVPGLPESHDHHTVLLVMIIRLLYCYANTPVSKLFYCVSLCLLYVLYCSIVLRFCTYLCPCSV